MIDGKLSRFIKSTDQFIIFIGRCFAWCLVLLVAVTLYDVVSRRIPALALLGSTGLQEIEWHLHTVLFAFLFAGVLVKDMNVRVDIFREKFSDKLKLHIEFWGTLLLAIPYAITVIYFGIEFVKLAFVAGEGSSSSHGLPYRWLIKSAIPIGMFLLLIAAFNRLLYYYCMLFMHQDTTAKAH